jgi:hypothetical protein
MNLRLDDHVDRRKDREVFLSGFVFGFVVALLTTLIGYWTIEQGHSVPTCEAVLGQAETSATQLASGN